MHRGTATEQYLPGIMTLAVVSSKVRVTINPICENYAFDGAFYVMITDKHCPLSEATLVKNCSLINGIAASLI